MKRLAWIALAPAVMLAGCAEISTKLDEARLTNGFDARLVTRPVPTRPNVFVDTSSGTSVVVVDQEPIVVKHGEVTVAWALASDSPYTFNAKNAIRIDGVAPERFNCKLGGSSAKSVVCSYYTPEAVIIKYTITIQSPSGEIRSIDPHMIIL